MSDATLAEPTVLADAPPPEPTFAARARSALSFSKISALYIFAALFVVYAAWIGSDFLAGPVWRSILDNGALTALTAIALVIPLSAGVFNLAIGTEVGLGAIFVAWLLAKSDVAIAPAIALTLLAGALIGVISGLLITRIKIDSFIATLGMSSILLALIAWISGSQQILDLGTGFARLGTDSLLGLTYPVWIALIVAILLWYVLERTPTGRRVYATGGNVDAARLAGVRTNLVIVLSLMTCGIIASLAGLLASARIATGDPSIGPSFLLPAYAAAFLGSTQFKSGRYNIWGTIVAVYVLAVGVKGLQLGGAPVWIPDLFNGVALLVAVGAAKFQRAAGHTSAIRRLLDRDGGRGGSRKVEGEGGIGPARHSEQSSRDGRS